jgi:hypothetical protein
MRRLAGLLNLGRGFYGLTLRQAARQSQNGCIRQRIDKLETSELGPVPLDCMAVPVLSEQMGQYLWTAVWCYLVVNLSWGTWK